MKQAAAFILAFLTCIPALAEPQFRVDGDTVFYEDTETRETIWIFRHKGLTLDEDDKPEHPIQGPIEHERRWYYSVEADLLEVDPERGQIVDRTHYSMIIDGLRVGEDGHLEVVLSHGEDLEEDMQLVARHTGESPGRGFWKNGIVSSFRAVRGVTNYLDGNGWENSSEDRASVVGPLRAASERDRTNPFYLGYLGLFADLDGESRRADERFAEAMQIEAPWFDTIRLCGLFHRAERTGMAEEACSKALKQMKAEKIRPKAMFGLLTFVSVTSDHRIAMSEAVAAKDHVRADRIAAQMYTLFPRVESSHQAWRVLADWYDAEDKTELANKWRARSVEVENSPITQVFSGGARRIDHMLLVSVSVMLLLPFAGLLIGLRTSRRKPHAEGAAKWIPRPSVLEVISIVLVVGVAVYSGHQAAKHITMIGEFASMPVPLLSEGHGSPDVLLWLDGQMDGPAKDELLAYARHEHEQARKGAAIEKQPPPPEALLRLVDRDARASVWDEFLESGSFKIFERASSFGEGSMTPSVPVGLPVLIVFVFFLFVGSAASRLVPRFSKWAGWLIPGGSANAGWTTPLILGAFIVGSLWILTPLGSNLQELMAPAFPKYFGLENLAGGDFLTGGPASWLPWVLIVGSLVAHGGLVYLDRRKPENA